MKQFTHAWMAFMAIKRLEKAKLSGKNRKYADNLVQWFMNHKDDVIQGAWYPDSVIKDMANSHVLKLKPSGKVENKFKCLPETYLNLHYGENSPVRNKSFTVDKHDNLPDRCESIAHSVIDHLKMQECEEKGSPVSPTDNQIALLLFMLSHYVADAHMPLHCDNRKFPKKRNLHAIMEGKWDDTMRRFYEIDEDNERFVYDRDGYPLRNRKRNQEYRSSFLKKVEKELDSREFVIGYGTDNNNVWDFMSAICQHSYLLSYCFIPEDYDLAKLPKRKWQSLGSVSFDKLNVAVFSDAIDSIARVWFRIWRRYLKWEKKQRAKK